MSDNALNLSVVPNCCCRGYLSTIDAGRCRNPAQEGSQYCHAHAQNHGDLVMPTCVIVTVNVNRRWRDKLGDEGARADIQYMDLWRELNTLHGGWAEAVGRAADAIQSHVLPDTLGNGASVFPKETGAQYCRVDFLLEELQDAGYKPVMVFLAQKEGQKDKNMWMFRIVFYPASHTFNAVGIPPSAWELFSVPFEYLHLHVNPRGPQGGVSHCINAVHRLPPEEMQNRFGDELPTVGKLVLDGFYWDVVPCTEE